MNPKLTRVEAISMVGIQAVDNVDKEDCIYNGVDFHTTEHEWIAYIPCKNVNTGDNCRLYAYYYTTSDNSLSTEEQNSHETWEIAFYRVVLEPIA